MEKKNFFKTFWGGVVITIIILVIAYFVWSIMKSGGITFAFTGPDEVRAGEIRNFHLVCTNNSRVVLEDASVDVQLPAGIFSREDPAERVISYNLGEIIPHSSQEKVLPLMITGEPQTEKSIEAVLRYRPKTLSAFFSRKMVKNVLISGSVFRLDLTYPQQVFSEQVFPLQVNWENLGTETFDNIEIKPEWPEGLVVQDANPEAISEGGEISYWSLGSLGPAAQGKILIHCFLSGQVGETKRIALSLGLKENNKFYSLTKTEGYITLATNPLMISSLANGKDVTNASLGDTLNFDINYQNNYSASLRNLVIRTKFTGDVFDFSSLKAPRGTYSSRLKTITWTGGNVPSLYVLNPGERGSLHFTIRLKKDWTMESLAQKNTIMTVETSIESSNIPEQVEVQEIPRAASTNTIKLNDKVQLALESYFRDAPSHLVNEGRLPLQVNQPTEFTIHWKIKNSFNALKNVEVRTTLPQGVEFTGKVAGNYGVNIPVYNPASRIVSWDIPLIPAGAGVIARPYEAIFQIKVIPSSSQLHQAVNLTGETNFQATDAFTQNQINLTYPSLQSNQLTDKTVFPGAGIVQP